MWTRTIMPLVALVTLSAGTYAQFNNPEGVDIWCGKAYRAGDASFSPGGGFVDPPLSPTPLLHLQVKPRMSIYLDTDVEGSIIVNTGVSRQLGEPIAAKYLSPSLSSLEKVLKLVVLANGTPMTTAVLGINSTNNEIAIDLGYLAARFNPHNITVLATLANGIVYSASTTLHRLPYPDDYGSVSRLDNLYGGLWVQRGKNSTWEVIFPYTYYVQWSLYWDSNVTTLDDFAAMGYNMIHIVPTGTLAESPFPWDQFQPYLDRAAELGLFLQYDFSWTPTNDSSMVEQATRLRKHPSILLWYQSDEPDGKSNPLNSTGLARNTLWTIDPYHPSSLALNCADFYYSDYAAGGEIVISDVYPVSTNTSWSTVYDTPCNATYGCCGCDNCGGSFEDITLRLQDFHHRDELLGWQKTHWAAPQAFGNETFWTRYPNAAEVIVMSLVAVNHGAKGLVAWDFPTTAGLSMATTQLAKVMTSSVFSSFVLQTPISESLAIQGGSLVDAAVWVNKETKEALLTVINLNYADLKLPIQVALPANITVESVSSNLWGNVSWSVTGEGNTLLASAGLLGLQASMVILSLA
ncbi:hypothetical protein CMQ_7907 [Grosmannia clavigera kw1407]|uniref:Glycoside hydrolase subgroup catalytic core n=1 Tax=Grosmannia clavigera (strain kw1407 / UAMH 11150) TaxID=655863 RepID=F0XS47_GROCL|nr:uncharacterized protein CMQ_7907 [Grosmannia clavigera kw1407]EFW99539.1 hypothetical protein CMQ_7907 [Grosmannia clavigera kw1407]